MMQIALSRLTKRFPPAPDGSTAGIFDLSMKANEGEVIALVGPSGSGKSTLLRLIAGLIPPDSGQVLYDDVPLDQVPLEKRGIGMVFQDHALMPHWKARQSVGFFLSLRRRTDEMPPRLERIGQITGFDLDTLLDRRPSRLSGGEQQRVAIARLLMRDPRVFLFDEPFAHIDPQFRTTARIELRRLLNEFPVTSFYVTHDQAEAVALGNRIGVMRDGRMEQLAPYETLYRRPANLFVAQFIGTPTMNEFAGQIGGGIWHGASFSVPQPHLPDGTAAALGLRPEHLRLVEVSRDESERITFSATVHSTIPMWNDRRQVVEANAGRETFTLFAPLDRSLSTDEAISVTFSPADALFFDAKTGRRISG